MRQKTCETCKVRRALMARGQLRHVGYESM